MNRNNAFKNATTMLNSSAVGIPSQRDILSNTGSKDARKSIEQPLGWGWFPILGLTSSFGLFLISIAFSSARAAASGAESLFWLGLLLLLVPITARLTMEAVSRRERIALVTVLGLACYLVKVMHSPVAFTFPDELSHYRNVAEVLRTHHLFQENPLLPVTTFYPGLQTVTSTLVLLSGADTFPVGIIVIGAARLILFLSLYLLNERILGSARVAGLATVIYMTNTNFVFWMSQYAYESLALPLLVLVLFVLAYRHSIPKGAIRVGLSLVALLGVMTIIITHHMSSYATLALLWMLVVLYLIRSRGKERGPLALAIVALVGTAAWLWFVAHYTIEYLSPVLGQAIESTFRMVVREEGATRELFKSSSRGYVAPVWERWVALGSVMLIALLQPIGLWRIWQRYRANVIMLLLTAISLIYLPLQLMRLTPAGWETANRTSEFLFLGLGLVLAIAIVDGLLSSRAAKLAPLLVPVYVAILFMGGVIAGWSPEARMPRPYAVQAGTGMIEPPGVPVADWMLTALGPDNRTATDQANARFIGAYGFQYPLTGTKYGIRAMIFSPYMGQNEQTIIGETEVRYILVDRRAISWNNMIGFYFNHLEASPPWELEPIDPEAYAKFDEQKGVSRILDAGNLILYDVGVLGEPK